MPTLNSAQKKYSGQKSVWRDRTFAGIGLTVVYYAK